MARTCRGLKRASSCPMGLMKDVLCVATVGAGSERRNYYDAGSPAAPAVHPLPRRTQPTRSAHDSDGAERPFARKATAAAERNNVPGTCIWRTRDSTHGDGSSTLAEQPSRRQV